MLCKGKRQSLPLEALFIETRQMKMLTFWGVQLINTHKQRYD